MSRVGLRFSSSLTYDSWERAGVQLSRILDSSAWCLGDWLICGQENYADRYVRAIKVAGLDYQTLRNYAWVARRFELSRRREMLSFQHHAEVAALATAEQDRWLDRAEKAAWSRNELRRQLRQSRSDEQPSAKPTSLIPRLPVAQERVERWRAAARRSNDPFANWIVGILDRAAEDALSAESPQHE
ncbi:LmbU family transcriptional regulator [Streptomyces odontomachi]|uniref:LmbU family transcriptional regulator n=1 Tax=Streptomyces odontomachi TaxID=2944940 RepID=UPI00210E2AE2|nr:LmbU family transcriptional regulator [Streptomyces sp. ODS25]